MTPILSSQSGMSLVEVLVALFILALASAAIVMTLPRKPSRIDREVARLELAIDRLTDEAIASGEVRAIRLEDDEYVAQAWRDSRWVTLPRSAHKLPSPLTISVSTTRRGIQESDLKDWPDIVADATGIVSARSLTLAEGADRRVLTVSSSGMVEVER
jgi:prepilin-type N-terminal cleavage/methylation domain-containing protein